MWRSSKVMLVPIREQEREYHVNLTPNTFPVLCNNCGGNISDVIGTQMVATRNDFRTTSYFRVQGNIPSL